MKYRFKSKESVYRYEGKFLIQGLSTKEIESLVNVNPEMFQFSYYKRIVNNIYFDDFNLSNYHDNINGNSERIKIRVRWYGSTFNSLKNPKLEVKIKNGLLGSKEVVAIENFNLNEDLSNVLGPLRDTYLYKKYNLGSVSPVLLNSYSRSYYISNNKRFRITIDDAQSYYKIGKRNNFFANKIVDTNSKILEIKYNDKVDDYLNVITNNFPFRMSKNSKYVNGIEMFY